MFCYLLPLGAPPEMASPSVGILEGGNMVDGWVDETNLVFFGIS